jgi:hypothetical protein
MERRKIYRDNKDKENFVKPVGGYPEREQKPLPCPP